ncbi:hypothetical protein Bca4012_084057 [Brassica carinata]
MEAITKYGLHSQALVHLRQQNFGWEFDGLWREIETLKPRLSDKLVCSDTKNRILLINTLVNLGVAYHFEKEIEEFMKDAFEKVEDITGGEEDMYTISVIFRVFRRYGHNVSSDMFNKFKGENGDFKKCLTDDVRDDACDAYCTLTEVIGLVHSLERWEFDAVDTLPDHLKVVLKSLIDLFEELKGEVRSEGRLYSVQYAIDELKRLFRANLTIARWARTGYIPNFDEYMEVGLVTGGVHTLLAIAFVARLRDDVATFKDEMGRGENATRINCYMKQYGVTEKEAFLEFHRKIKHVSKQIIDVNYKYGDGYTYTEMVRGNITSLFLDLVTL